jgi:hypothetical protein
LAAAGAVFAGAEPAVGSAWAAFPAGVASLVEAVRLPDAAPLTAVAPVADAAPVAGVESLAACAVVVGAGGWADLPDADV